MAGEAFHTLTPVVTVGGSEKWRSLCVCPSSQTSHHEQGLLMAARFFCKQCRTQFFVTVKALSANRSLPYKILRDAHFY